MTESVREIEAEIEATRSRLFDTIGRIQDKLTVSGIVDEVMGQAGVPRMENGHDFVLGLLRRHPVPVMIAAAGLGFMIYRQNRRARSSTSLRQIEDANYVEVPVSSAGQARVYDPGSPTDRPASHQPDTRPALEAQA